MILVLLKLLSAILAKILLIVALVGLAIFWRLSLGPVALPFLAEPAARFVERSLPGWRVSLSNVILDWRKGAAGGAATFSDLRIQAPNGALAAAAETAVGRVGFTGPNGALALAEISLVGPKTYLSRDYDGRIRFGIGAPPDEASGFGALAAALGGGGGGGLDGGAGAIQRIEIVDAALVYADAASGRTLSATGADLALQSAAFGLIATLEAEVDDEAGRPWRVSVQGWRRSRTGALRASVRFEDVDPVALAAQSDALRVLRVLRAPVSGEAELRVDADGALVELAAELEAGPGALILGETTHGLAHAGLSLSYDPAARAVLLRQGALTMAGFSVVAEGEATLTGEGEALGAEGTLTLQDLRVGPNAEPDVRISEIRARFAIDPQAGVLRLDEATARDLAAAFGPPDARIRAEVPEASLAFTARLDGGGARLERLSASALKVASDADPESPLRLAKLTVSGSARRLPGGGGSGRGEFSADLGAIPLSGSADATFSAGSGAATVRATAPPFIHSDLVAAWPAAAAPGGRRWVSERVLAGRLENLNLWSSFSFGQTPRAALSLTGDLRGGRVLLHPSLPPVSAEGRLEITERTVTARVDAGHIDSPQSGGRLDVSGSVFHIPNLRDNPPDGEVSLKMLGPLRGVLRFLEGEPLRVTERAGLDPLAASGLVSVGGTLRLPLKRLLPAAEVGLDIAADITDYALRVPGMDLPLQGPKARVTVAGGLVQIVGEGETLESPLTYRFTQPIARRADGAGAVLTVTAEASSLLAARFGLPEDLLSGAPPQVEARVAFDDRRAAVVEVDADLAPAAFGLDALGWRKEAGTPATLAIRGGVQPDRSIVLSTIDLRSPEAAISASAHIGADRSIRLIEAPVIRLAGAADVSVELWTEPDGERRARVSGQGLDLRLVVERAREGGDGPPTPPPLDCGPQTRVALDLDHLRLTEEIQADAAAGVVIVQPCGLLAADIGFKAGGYAPARLLMRRLADGLGLELTSPDAGALLRALGIYDSARGGDLKLEARARTDVRPPLIRGRLRADDLVIVNAPTFATILSRGSIIGLLDELNSGGVTFTRVHAPFSGDGRRWRINGAAAYGPSLGITLEGTYHMSSKALNLSGALSPAFAINGVLSQLPVIGELAGGEGAGLFGVSYMVGGTSEAPRVSVNPISSLAPGIFRNILQTIMQGG